MKNKLLIILLFTLLTQHTLYSQWFQQQIPVNKPVIGIKFLDSLKGWAATSWGSAQDTSFVINTTNGGNNWNIQLRFGIGFFEAFSMIDENTGYVGGYSPLPGPGPLMFKTTNGGLNWINKGAPSGPTDLFFINRDTGWYCNNAFAADVRITTDGGNSWQLRNSSIASNANRIFFLNYNTGWCGQDGYLHKTTNAGLNWLLNGTFSEGVRAIYFINENTGWLGFTGHKIAFTSNSGNNWAIQQPFPLISNNITDIQFLNQFVGWAGTGWFQKILKSTNSGINWGYQSDTSGSIRVSFVDTLKGWSANYFISHTSNGGGSITYIGIISNNKEEPEQFILFQNYPNPFNPKTNIKFSLIKPSYVQLKIFDLSGKELNPWIFGWYPEKLLEPGIHELKFDGSDMASGAYFYKLIVTDKDSKTLYEKTRKMILIK